MKCVFENGINMFDMVECYVDGECEIVMGKVIKKLNWRRSDVILVIKIFFGFGGKDLNVIGLSRKYVIEGIDVVLKCV